MLELAPLDGWLSVPHQQCRVLHRGLSPPKGDIKATTSISNILGANFLFLDLQTLQTGKVRSQAPPESPWVHLELCSPTRRLLLPDQVLRQRRTRNNLPEKLQLRVSPQAWTLAPRPGTALMVTKKRTPGFPELCPQGMLP